MPEKILVTGATGPVGSRLVERLVKHGGVKVLAGTRNPEKASWLAKLGADLVEMDLDDPDSTATALANIDKLYMLTPGQGDQVQQGNNLISAAESAGVKRVVRQSAIGAESDPAIFLQRLTRSVEVGLMGSDLNWTFLRPNGFMQNYEQFAESIKTRGEFYLPAGDCKVSYVDAADIADVAVTILLDNTDEYSEKTYDITGPEAIDNYQVAAAFSEVLGREVKYIPIPDEVAAENMLKMGMPKPLVDALIELYQWYRSGAGAVVSGAVGALTGHTPRTFREYVADNRAKYE
jgi:uncharacterized protein YbjT (DUF2867 family)